MDGPKGIAFHVQTHPRDDVDWLIHVATDNELEGSTTPWHLSDLGHSHDPF